MVDKLALAKAYIQNKDTFHRSLSGLPHYQVVDTALTVGKSDVPLTYTLQNNAGVEIWQLAQDTVGEEYDEKQLMKQLKGVVSEMKAKTPKTLYVELDLSPWSSPPQAKFMQTLEANGYKLHPGHDSYIVVGEISAMCESLFKTLQNTPRRLRVLRMSEPQHGRDFGKVAHAAFQIPPPWSDQSFERLAINATRDWDSEQFFYFVGYLESNGDPATCVTLCLDAGTVGIHWAGTHPKYQKQGLFQELLYTVLHDLLPNYSTDYTHYSASARPTSAAFFQKHGAEPMATKYKYILYSNLE